MDSFFLQKKIDGIYDNIGIIRCEKAYKSYSQDSFGPKIISVFDFCFEDFFYRCFLIRMQR